MFLVIAQKQYKYGDEVEVGEFDYHNPVGIYEDQGIASQHAQTHAQNHGVAAIVVHQDDLDSLIHPKTDELPAINVWNTTRGRVN